MLRKYGKGKKYKMVGGNGLMKRTGLLVNSMM